MPRYEVITGDGEYFPCVFRDGEYLAACANENCARKVVDELNKLKERYEWAEDLLDNALATYRGSEPGEEA